MKNLNRITWRANKDESGSSKIDRRKLPVCERTECRRKVALLPDGDHMAHCYLHMPAEQWNKYKKAWGLK